MARDQADIATFIVGWLGEQRGYKVGAEAVRLTDVELSPIPKLSGHLATLP